jgi:hypothetical protein
MNAENPELIQRSHIFRKEYPEKWQALRKKVFARAYGQCECPGGYENGGERGSTRCENDIDHIHHLVYLIDPHETRHHRNGVLDTLPCCRFR